MPELDRRRRERGPADALKISDATRVHIVGASFSEAARIAGSGLDLRLSEWAFTYGRRARFPRVYEPGLSRFEQLEGPTLEAAVFKANGGGEHLMPSLKRLLNGELMHPHAHRSLPAGLWAAWIVHLDPPSTNYEGRPPRRVRIYGRLRARLLSRLKRLFGGA